MSTAFPAGWPEPNYVNPEERSWLPIFLGITVGVATVTAWIRFWFRVRRLAGGVGLDDVSATPAVP